MDLKMKLDKKSLIQIVILIVLIAGGAGAYLMQQDGGLDFISGMFESEPATIRAPAAVAKKPPAPEASSPAPGGDKAAKVTAPAAPIGPVAGQMHGKPFALESSFIEGGALALRSAETEIKVMLPGSPWEMPAGKSFKVMDVPGADSPRVALNQQMPEKFTLTLEFGQEKNGKLPGKIQLGLADGRDNVAGSFEADIKGFRIVDGRPDLTADSVDTLQYLALRELLKDDPNKSLEVISFRDGRYAAGAPGKNMTGSIEVEYRVRQGSSAVQQFRFEKEAGAWKVVSAQKKAQSKKKG